MNDRKIIIVAKCFDSITYGPTNIVRGLVQEFSRQQANFETVILKEGVSKTVFIKALISTLKSNENAVVNVHTDGYLIPMLVWIMSQIFRGHSFYLTVHGIYAIEAKMEGKAPKRYIFLEKFLYTHYPKIICVSEMLKSNIADLFGRKDNVFVIPNATEASSNSTFIPGKKKRLVSIGGLKKRKGIDVLLAFSEEIKKQGKDIEIKVYGEPHDNEKWFNMEIKKRNIADIIEYKGLLINKQDLYDEIVKYDAQLCFSLYDTFNVAIAESLVLGCPCISSDMCGAAYLIHGESGLIIDLETERNSNYQGVFDYVSKLNYETRKRIEDRASEYQKMLSWKSIAKSYMELL